ncbi:glycosyltransferase [Acinetobacter bereziniae]|uniref:glycosyltransferase n=1 Tax=Acinetobacter bereziniae TaxID=106648 RepID=UPI002074FBC9|nr:glycosyltransferase [Acinetobacter bereziniae]MCM8512869.1 glycosyltransferase [Acinetobacter bereziniae]
MKILYLITGLGGGGAEKVVADLADQMTLRGHSVKIAYLKGNVVVSPQNNSIELVYIGLESLKDVRKAYQNYKNLINTFNPNVVHAHMVHANIFARISRKFCYIPKLICTAHSNNEGGKARMLAYKLTHNLSDLTTNVSLSATKSFEELGAAPKDGIQTVYNGINLSKFKKNEVLGADLRSLLNIAEDEFLLLAVGRLNQAKDYPNLLQALHLVLKQNLITKKINLVIVGEGKLRPDLEELIQVLELRNNVRLIGRRDDIPQLMSAADIFILSSSFEGFGLVVAEAMACETYVVATDCGGVKEVMGGYGTLVPPKDSNALAQAIYITLNQNRIEIEKNNVAALSYVKKTFSLENIADQWIQLYEQ